LKAVLICAALACGLGGCGQTGILYLPTKEGEVVSKGPAGAAAPATTAAPAATAAPTGTAADADSSEAVRKRESAVPAPAPK